MRKKIFSVTVFWDAGRSEIPNGVDLSLFFSRVIKLYSISLILAFLMGGINVRVCFTQSLQYISPILTNKSQ